MPKLIAELNGELKAELTKQCKCSGTSSMHLITVKKTKKYIRLKYTFACDICDKEWDFPKNKRRTNIDHRRLI